MIADFPDEIKQFWNRRYSTVHYTFGLPLMVIYEGKKLFVATVNKNNTSNVVYFLDGQLPAYSEEEMLSIVKSFGAFV